MKPKLILFALVLSSGLFGCSSTSQPASHNGAVSFERLFGKIEQQIPELESIGVKTDIPLSGRVWRGDEYATADFVLRNNIRYHPVGEFPRETAPVPYADINVAIARYASSEIEQDDLTNTFRLRQATFLPKEVYKGAVLYRHKGTSEGVVSAICQSGQYIIEISAYSEIGAQWTMKVLDTILPALDSTLSSDK
jgi:hypothetical protein